MEARIRILVGSMFLVAMTGIHAEPVQPQSQIEPATGQAASQARGAEPSMRSLDKGPPRHLSHLADEIEWVEGPGSFEPGAHFAVLEGDPGKDGIFTMQVRLPDGFLINPHWHPNVERLTVLRGTFLLGSGETVDKEAAMVLKAGSYTAMPPEMVHFAIVEGETVVQLTTVGPWEIHYVNPEHDPRK